MELLDIGKLSVPMLIALGLNIIGAGISKSFIDNKHIPLALILLGGVVNIFLGSTTEIKNPSMHLFMQGICIGGLAIGLNQTVRQYLNK